MQRVIIMKAFNPAWYYLLPLLLAVHNVEEALGMAAWTRSHPGALHPPVTDRQFAAAVVIVTILAVIATIAARTVRGGRHFIFIMTTLAWILVINALFPHAVGSVYYGTLAPGMVTAGLLYLTVVPYLLWRSLVSGMIGGRHFLIAFLLAPVVGLAATALSLWIGRFW